MVVWGLWRTSRRSPGVAQITPSSMPTVAQPVPPKPPDATFPSGLLAVRRAGAPFGGSFALRSRRFDALLDQRTMLLAELMRIRDELLEALHRAVPRATERNERRRLLQVKRNVFNLRPSASSARLPPDLVPALTRYDLLLARESVLFEKGRAEVLREQRRALAQLLEDERFRAACRYSSASLWEAAEHSLSSPSREQGDEYSTLERGLYAYAIRFVSKANPLHLFADVILPPSMGLGAEDRCEVVLDTSLIFDLERNALAHGPDGTRLWLSLPVFTVEDGRCRFWVPSARGARVFSLPRNGLIDAVAGFFAHRHRTTGRPTGTRAECEAYLREHIGPDRSVEVPALLSALIEKGILRPYLVTDLNSFGEALSGVDPTADSRVARLQQVHLATLDPRSLPAVEAELAASRETDRPRYYVNRYAGGATVVHEVAANALCDDLRVLKPFFCVEHNFAANDAVAKTFVLERLNGDGAAPLLELLGPFVRELDTLIARVQTGAGHARGESLRPSWGDALSAESGRLDRTRLDGLLPHPLPPARSLCFNGPFDYVEGTFYPSNVWAGDGRFVSRYLLHRRSGPRGEEKRSSEPGVIDVELAVPPHTNLNYVVRAYAVGCGFDARYSHEFEAWIDPAQVVVEVADGRVVYRHGPTWKRLRIHYRGFLLAQYLPVEYQLLLIGHADTFHNPFSGSDVLPEDGGIRHIEPLHYGAVCLRRERWVVPAATFARSLADADPLRRTARLRDLLHERLREGVDYWYYRTPHRVGKGHKPQFLDLRNPLGVATFRRALASLPDDGVVSLSPMQPVPAHLHHEGGMPYVTELMVEA